MRLPRPVPAQALVIKNGMVIDGTSAAPILDGVVVIDDQKIIAVGRATDFVITPETQFIDAQGGTILPGIINAHVHEASSNLVRKFYFLRKGVTAVCDLANPLSNTRQLDDGYGLTARRFYSGPLINVPLGYPGTPEYLYEVNSPEEARQAVSDLVGRGASMIKIALEPGNPKVPWVTPRRAIIPNLDLPMLQAIVAQAHAHNKLVRVHIGTAEELDLALDAGVDVLEHIPLPALDDINFNVESPDGFARLSPAYEKQLNRVVQQGVVMVPTLDQIIPWCENRAETNAQKALCSKYALAPVHRFHQLGGVIALGDDSGYMMRTEMPVREMQWLAQAGLTPMEIIQAGTRNAARVCGHGDELGTLEPGKLADMIIVPGNPLANLNAFETVSHVILGGRVAVSPN